MDLVSRLKQYLNFRGISITQFADECEIPRPTASQLLAGRNKKVSDEIIGKIHYTYPDLSVSWLMFGEGDMVADANIKTSEPQTDKNGAENRPQHIEPQDSAIIEDNIFSEHDSDANTSASAKIANEDFYFGDTTFTFGPNHGTSHIEPRNESPVVNPPTDSNRDNDSANMTQAPQANTITVTPEKGKCVTGIVVYYSDSTYESFIPDPDAKIPFIR